MRSQPRRATGLLGANPISAWEVMGCRPDLLQQVNKLGYFFGAATETPFTAYRP
jgi:hypothetical protein